MEHKTVPADVDAATATWDGGQLRIQASGTVPESCWVVDLVELPIEIWPPQFAVNRRRTAAICAQVITPYVVAESFSVGDRAETIVLHHAGGEMLVEVEDAPEAPAGILPGGGGDGYAEAEGRSVRRYSFDEAFSNAVEALGPSESPIADWMDTVVVTQIRAEIGGIAGSRDLVVRVRRGQPPS